MALPVTIPNTFANATSSIPLSQLDTNFGTLANAVNGLNSGSETLANLKATTANVGVLTVTGNATLGDSSTDTVTLNSTLTANTAVIFAAGTSAAPSITTTGDTNTGIFFPAADTIAFTEGGAEAMRIDSDGDVGIGTTSPSSKLHVVGSSLTNTLRITDGTNYTICAGYLGSGNVGLISTLGGAASLAFGTDSTERMRIDSSGRVGIGATNINSQAKLEIAFDQELTTLGESRRLILNDLRGGTNERTEIGFGYASSTKQPAVIGYQTTSNTSNTKGILYFATRDVTTDTAPTERARITSGGDFLVGTTNASPASSNVDGVALKTGNPCDMSRMGGPVFRVNRGTDDGELVQFLQDGTQEGNISVSGSTVSYNGFSGGHWSQLQQGRGYNPDILRGTVMSTIGEMCEWKSVVWDEVIEHPAVPAVEAKEAVLDEEGNVIEPAVEEVKGKDAWTETIPHREAYLGNLAVGATFEEDGFTKTVVDDGNERLPKVKISDVVGDKAVYGVFQTWDEVQDMLVTSLGAFVVRIASGVTVQIGDLLESNGDGCAKVQDDDVIRSKTIAKVTSTTPTATYADGSYTVPAVIYCG